MDLSGRLPKYGVPSLLAKNIVQADQVITALKDMITEKQSKEYEDSNISVSIR